MGILCSPRKEVGVGVVVSKRPSFIISQKVESKPGRYLGKSIPGSRIACANVLW